MRKRGVNFSKYCNNIHQKTKKLPVYMVQVEHHTQFVYDDKELAKVTKKQEEAEYIEIFETDDISAIQKNLNKFGLDICEFAKAKADAPSLLGRKIKKKPKKEEAKPLFLVENEKEKQELCSLSEVLRCVRDQATKGIHIQRYKGLGEMNPHQLWETTMDPQKRTLLQVTLEDSVEADKTFTTLMGDQVAPRREFIETYAHEAKNLDI